MGEQKANQNNINYYESTYNTFPSLPRHASPGHNSKQEKKVSSAIGLYCKESTVTIN